MSGYTEQSHTWPVSPTYGHYVSENKCLSTLTHFYPGWLGASLAVQMVKNLPAVQEIWVRSRGREDPPGEGNGNPLQYSCLGNPMNIGA